MNRNCNYCGTKMRDCHYANSIAYNGLFIDNVWTYIKNLFNNEHKVVGEMKYCPNCGNLQVDLKEEKDEEN